MLRIEKSGLKQLMETCTFDSFSTEEKWQARAKQMAQDFLQDCAGNWFYAGGQVGSGKTHICTAIVGELLRLGKSARYMLWRDDIVKLKALVTDDEAYSSKIGQFKETEVLYIDDFFKTERGKTPTTADVNIAFELLNYRYNDRGLTTIISSERQIDELLDIDEAVGSRIYQRSQRYCLIIGNDKSKNYRLRGASGKDE
jgi:DNA replication protein DnaC